MFSPYNIYFLHQSHIWASEISFCFHDLTLQNHLKSNYNAAIFREFLNFLSRTQTCLDFLHLNYLHFKWSSSHHFCCIYHNLETKLVFEIATYLEKKISSIELQFYLLERYPEIFCGRTWYILFIISTYWTSPFFPSTQYLTVKHN